MLQAIKEKLYVLKVWYRQIFMYPKQEIPITASYDDYWEERGMKKEATLNDWQLGRSRIIAGVLKKEKKISITDIGCGNGGVLAYIQDRIDVKTATGVDISKKALDVAKQFHIQTVRGDFLSDDFLKGLPSTDYFFLLEVLEHSSYPERMLTTLYTKVRKGVFFSVPNSGYIKHRLRLLFGKTPLQWRVHPSEHVRFWTLADLHWWMKALGYRRYTLFSYQGVPLLSKVWPALFAGGLLVYVQK